MQTMNSTELPSPPISLRFLLSVLVVGGLAAGLLSSIEAPFWSFYLMPVLMAPLMLRELRRIDAVESTREARSANQPLAD